MAAFDPGPMTIGFVGLGRMGWPMAARLVEAGFTVVVYDLSPERTREFARRHAAVRADRLGAVAEISDIVITMLPDSTVVGDALFGAPDSLGPYLRPAATVIEMSSGDPEATIGLAARLSERRVGMIDAPVSGGVKRAADGTLTIMTGGEDPLIEPCIPVLEAIGSVMRAGGLGSGQAMKALNNLVSAGGFLIGMEALLIGRKFGLDPATMVGVLNASTGSNNSTKKKFKQFVLSGTYDSGFALDLMVKDLTTAIGIARSGRVEAPFSALCRELWAAALAQAGPGADHTELARFSERLADAGRPSPGSGNR